MSETGGWQPERDPALPRNASLELASAELRAELRQILAIDGGFIVQEWRATVAECPRLAAILREPGW